MGELEIIISFTILAVLIFSTFIILGQKPKMYAKETFEAEIENNIRPLRAFDKCNNDKLYLTDTPNIPVDEQETFFLGFNANEYMGAQTLIGKDSCISETKMGLKKLVYDGVYNNYDFAHAKFKTREFVI